MSAWKGQLTDADVEGFVRLLRDQLLAAKADGVDVTIHTRRGVRETTQPGDQWKTHARTARFSLELHLAGGVDPRNEELPMPLDGRDTLPSLAAALRQHARAIEHGQALAAHVVRDLRAVADLLDPPGRARGVLGDARLVGGGG